MTDMVASLANAVVVLTYLAISLTIARGLWTSGQWRTNKLGTATSAIFFTCALGHAAHVAGYLAASLAGRPAHEHADAPGLGPLGAFWDAVTAGVAIWYWSLRGRFPALVRGAAVFEDLRLRQTAERRLRLSERRYRGIVETTSEGVVLLDEAGLVEYANAQFAALIGFTSREARGVAFTDLVLPEYRDQLAKALAGVREHGTQRLEVELARGAGCQEGPGHAQRVFAQIALTARAEYDAAPSDGPVGPVASGGALAMVADVTERRNAEMQLRRAQRLDAVGQLAGGVAHDFNNLLTVIDGYAAILQGEVDGPASRDVTAIREAAGRASALTRQLLEFARTQPVRPEAVDVDELVVGIEDMLRRLIREDIQITVRAGVQGATVWADRGQLEQVLINLAVNSRDAMPDGGRLTISTARGPGPRGGDEITISVADTGHGIPEEIQGMIFEPFFSTKEPGQGTGLGLSTVYGIVRQAGGEIVVDSAVGFGTRIRVHLPAATVPPRQRRPDQHRDDAAGAAGLAGGRGTILLVEDDADIRRLSERILLAAGYEVLTAPDGRSAIDVAASAATLDLLVTDVIMPRMNGRQLADWLRAARPGLPVLYTSAYPRGLISATRSDGVYLEKPYTPSRLAATVNHLLASSAQQAGDPGPPRRPAAQDALVGG
jgi:signal transduction histidine kinase